MPYLILDLETTPSEVSVKSPQPNMANEVLNRLATFFDRMLSIRPRSRSESMSEWARDEVITTNMRLRDECDRLAKVLPHMGDFPPPPCHKIVCAGVALLTDGYELDDLSCVGIDGNEGSIVRELARLLSEDKTSPFPEHVVVTFNGRGFDLPVIAARAARHGVVLPYWSGRAWHNRYRTEDHIDIADYWAHQGACPRPSLSQTSKLIGLPGKREGEDGGSVASMVAEGKLDEVKRYCLSDVVQTAGVFLRTEYLQGRLHLDNYRRVAHRLLEGCEGAFGPGLEWVSEGTDRKVFLLDEGAS